MQTTHAISGDISINPGERKVLRELAKQVAELAARPCEEEKKKLWIMHNDLQPVRPLVFCDPEMGWNEIIGQNQILCKKPLFRVWEMILRKEIYWATQLKDDRVIEPFFNVPYDYVDMGWGLKEKVHQQNDRGSYVWDAPLTNYDEDFKKFRFQRIEVDFEKTKQIVDFSAHESCPTGYQMNKILSFDPIHHITLETTSCGFVGWILFRYAEVLLNYAEAKAELGTLTQEDIPLKDQLPNGYGFDLKRDYLDPFSTEELTLNKNLVQNPGW